MSMVKHSRIHLALDQFETAIALFLAKKDYCSVITLAGAADVIFCQVITRRGKENFTDMISKEDGRGLSRQQTGREINDMFFINEMKHFDRNDDEIVEFNPFENAYGCILKGLVNYKMIAGQTPPLDSFLAWMKENLDPDIYNIHCDPNWQSKKDK